ncbi:MAG: SRPBCC family protein, partial [Pseudomonadota bacterium]
MSDKIEKTIELKAPVSRVWRALTDHKEFGQWFRVDLDGPFKVGEVSKGKMTFPGYEHLPWKAVVRRMDDERLFSFSWIDIEPETGAVSEAMMLVEFRLEPIATGTRLTIIESGFDALPDPRRL